MRGLIRREIRTASAWRLHTMVAACIMLAAVFLATPAEATLCKPKHITQDHRAEANRVDEYAFGRWDYEGEHDYNARVLGCNRYRDMRSPAIERTNPENRTYPDTLPPRLIKGHIRYFNFAPMRYGYRLERFNGTWILTSIARFHFPKKKFHNRLDIPLGLAEELGIRDTICDSTEYKSVAGIDRGLIEIQGAPLACRVERNERFGGVPITQHYMDYWRDAITAYWSRDGFQVRMLITNLDDIPANQLADYERNNVIWEVRLNHNKNSRPMYKASVGRPHPLYAGIEEEVIVHEFGHSIGLDDEYPGSSNPPDYRDCRALGGDDYVMCNSWGDESTEAKGIYAWIATRRYGIGERTVAVAWNDAGAVGTTVVIDGSGGPGRTRYALGASDRLEKLAGDVGGFTATINDNDYVVDGKRATGIVGSAVDAYRVSGDLLYVELEDPAAATVYIDRQPIRHRVVIDGSRKPGRTSYRILATGGLHKVDGKIDGFDATINSNDRIRRNEAAGLVGSAIDGYYVFGRIEGITLDDPGAADVYVDGQRVTPDE
ncbi:zinc metalloprotease [Lentisalinibacter salinarum]|uniref:hypothetical protein n=1 Tax=Lentisalinibacter salinarum TaxID=2992239 RepID=UPI00386717BD